MADELRLSIEKLVYGGDGLAHADGNTVFVPYVLAGGRGARGDEIEEEEIDLGANCWKSRRRRRSAGRRSARIFRNAAAAITSTFRRRNRCG